MFPTFSSGGGSSKLAMYENGGYATSLRTNACPRFEVRPAGRPDESDNRPEIESEIDLNVVKTTSVTVGHERAQVGVPYREPKVVDNEHHRDDLLDHRERADALDAKHHAVVLEPGVHLGDRRKATDRGDRCVYPSRKFGCVPRTRAVVAVLTQPTKPSASLVNHMTNPYIVIVAFESVFQATYLDLVDVESGAGRHMLERQRPLAETDVGRANGCFGASARDLLSVPCPRLWHAGWLATARGRLRRRSNELIAEPQCSPAFATR